MRNILIMLMFTASLVHAALSDYEEVRDLSLDAGSLSRLRIEAGAGSLQVTGVEGSDRIVVKAVITVPDANVDQAARIIRDDMVLTLVKKGDTAELQSRFESGIRLFGDAPSIRLEVRVPAEMSLDVHDGSGSIDIRDVAGDVDLVDGSGSVRMTDAGGNLNVKDGSGSLEIIGAGGNVTVKDGSGSITLQRIAGSATIEDGSGSIEVTGVAGDLTIPEAGSGSLDVHDVRGRFENGD